MSTAVAVKAMKMAKKPLKIVKKRTKTFFRFQSDRFDRVKVCDPKMRLFAIFSFFLVELEKATWY
jgi:hypothetical protein